MLGQFVPLASSLFGSHGLASGALPATGQFFSPTFSTPTLAHSVTSLLHKPFVISPGYSPIPEKLVKKIKAGQFIDLADPLPENVKAQDSEPQTYMDGKLLVSTKRVRDITDIVTWVAAFTAFMWILCCTHPSRWQDMTQYKLLILQTTHRFSGGVWLHCGTAFQRGAGCRVWPAGPVWAAICAALIPAYLNINSSSLPSLHPHLQDHLPLHLISADPGIMAPVPRPTVNVGTVTAVKAVKESIHVSAAPFRPQCRLLGAQRRSDHGHPHVLWPRYTFGQI